MLGLRHWSPKLDFNFRSHRGLHNPRAQPSPLLAQPVRDSPPRFRRRHATFRQQGWCFPACRCLYILHVPIILTRSLLLYVHCKSIRVERSRLSDGLVFPARCVPASSVPATCSGKYCTLVLSIPFHCFTWFAELGFTVKQPNFLMGFGSNNGG